MMLHMILQKRVIKLKIRNIYNKKGFYEKDCNCFTADNNDSVRMQ